MEDNKTVAIFGAMKEEIEAYENLKSKDFGLKIITYETGIGKPRVAAGLQKIITEHKPGVVILAGVAATLTEEFKIGDICVGVGCIDADMDVRPLPGHIRGQQPFSEERVYNSDRELVFAAMKTPGIDAKRAYIATGSAFLDKEGKQRFLRKINPLLEANVEGKIQVPSIYDMESSAFLQIAKSNGIPALVMRAVSDDMKGNSVEDFNAFINSQAMSSYIPIIENILSQYDQFVSNRVRV